MNDKAFFDTNVILYAFRQDDTRSQMAETLLAAGGTLSVQVSPRPCHTSRLLSGTRATYRRDPRESRAHCRTLRVFHL